jgi:hypothetical protein
MPTSRRVQAQRLSRTPHCFRANRLGKLRSFALAFSPHLCVLVASITAQLRDNAQNIVLAAHRLRPSFATEIFPRPELQEGSRAPKGASFNQCPRKARLRALVLSVLHCVANCLAAKDRGGGAPPFGAHACGTRHRLLPRWLSPGTGFPAAPADGRFARFRTFRPFRQQSRS